MVCSHFQRLTPSFPLAFDPTRASARPSTLPSIQSARPPHVPVRGELGVVRVLLAAAADVNAVDSEGNTPLHFAARDGFQVHAHTHTHTHRHTHTHTRTHTYTHTCSQLTARTVRVGDSQRAHRRGGACEQRHDRVAVLACLVRRNAR